MLFVECDELLFPLEMKYYVLITRSK